MRQHAVIMRHDLPRFKELAEINELDPELEEKDIYFIDIKFITPNQFDPQLWASNWMFAYHVLSNGDVFFETYVLVVDSVDQLSLLTPEQLLIIKEYTMVLDD